MEIRISKQNKIAKGRCITETSYIIMSDVKLEFITLKSLVLSIDFGQDISVSEAGRGLLPFCYLVKVTCDSSD